MSAPLIALELQPFSNSISMYCSCRQNAGKVSAVDAARPLKRIQDVDTAVADSG